jgi:hypothetical protein
MPVVKNKTTDSNREFWSHVEEVTQQVNRWPDWMRNNSRPITPETGTSSDQKAGDVGTDESLPGKQVA